MHRLILLDQTGSGVPSGPQGRAGIGFRCPPDARPLTLKKAASLWSCQPTERSLQKEVTSPWVPSIPLRRGQTVWLRRVLYRDEEPLEVDVVLTWRRRMQIEESFRDTKSLRWGFPVPSRAAELLRAL